MIGRATRNTYAGAERCVRPLTPDDADAFVRLLEHLDRETPYLMFEPGERPVDHEGLRSRFGNPDPALGVVLGAFIRNDEGGNHLIGFLGAQRRQGRRYRHVMSLVVALRLQHVGLGHGRALLEAAIGFARREGVRRIELTVQSDNERARRLYEAAGFNQEGVRRDAVRLADALHDELSMALLLEG